VQRTAGVEVVAEARATAAPAFERVRAGGGTHRPRSRGRRSTSREEDAGDVARRRRSGLITVSPVARGGGSTESARARSRAAIAPELDEMSLSAGGAQAGR